MASRRSSHFDDRVDPRLIKAIEANQLKGYDTEMISGFRGKTPKNPNSRHGRGAALDVSLIDQATGKAVPNYQDAESFKTYQQYANQVYQWAQQNDPELAKQLAWGGYFSGGPGKYGALDLMHFDTGGMQAGGTWEGGLTPQQAKIWGLDAGGGLGAMNQASGIGGPIEAAGGGAVDPQKPVTVSHPPNPTVGTGDLESQHEQDLPPALTGSGKNWLENLGTGVGNVKLPQASISAMPQVPGAARSDAEAGISPIAARDPNRMALAQMMMQRLNSGRLF